MAREGTIKYIEECHTQRLTLSNRKSRILVSKHQTLEHQSQPLQSKQQKPCSSHCKEDHSKDQFLNQNTSCSSIRTRKNQHRKVHKQNCIIYLSNGMHNSLFQTKQHTLRDCNNNTQQNSNHTTGKGSLSLSIKQKTVTSINVKTYTHTHTHTHTQDLFNMHKNQTPVH